MPPVTSREVRWLAGLSVLAVGGTVASSAAATLLSLLGADVIEAGALEAGALEAGADRLASMGHRRALPHSERQRRSGRPLARRHAGAGLPTSVTCPQHWAGPMR